MNCGAPSNALVAFDDSLAIVRNLSSGVAEPVASLHLRCIHARTPAARPSPLDDYPPDPAYVQILCGRLDLLPHAFAALDSPAASESPCLEGQNRDADLRRRNRTWADHTVQIVAAVTSTVHLNLPRAKAF